MTEKTVKAEEPNKVIPQDWPHIPCYILIPKSCGEMRSREFGVPLLRDKVVVLKPHLHRSKGLAKSVQRCTEENLH